MNAYEQGLRHAAGGRHADAIGCFEQALGTAPNDTRVLFALGNTARALGMAGPAEAFFRQVLSLEPQRIEALVNLANLLRSQGQFDAAEQVLTPALARAPDSAELWLTMGSVKRETGDVAGAVAHYHRALALRPNYAAALGNLADLADDTETALALYDRVLRLEPDDAQARMNRAVLHLLKGDLKSGWRDYEARKKLPGKVPAATHGLPAWTGDSRKRLLVTAEQGVGDQIMFASLVPELGANIVLECEPRLVPLFQRSFPSAKVHAWDVETRGGVATARYGWLKHAGGANQAVAMGTLPRHLRKDIASFPSPHAYLVPDADEAARWRAVFGPAIGICWRSGKTGGHRALQYAPLEAWAAFLRRWPGTAVSVQYDATPDEIAQLETMSGRRIAVPQGIDQKNELDRACALLKALDAVVSAPTAVSWLAAGAGVATFKILYDNSWTSFGERHEPFAPSCACVMPDKAGDWAQCFDQVIRMLPAPA
ncbi:MAG: tetratricopeptide repeat protein [Alphaproteobacteria bacterium]|nr:tetratricopeptide repeat protein [Alphaproteobacteria bacterium]